MIEQVSVTMSQAPQHVHEKNEDVLRNAFHASNEPTSVQSYSGEEIMSGNQRLVKRY